MTSSAHDDDNAKKDEPELTPGQKEKKDMMDKANAGNENPAKSFKEQGEREVLDPVTKQMVIIKDAQLEG